jgi:hypothetical protein
VYRAEVSVAAGHPVVLARFAMFEFVVIEVSPLLKRSARGAGDGREYTQTTLYCQALFSELIFRRFFKPPAGVERRAGGGRRRPA